MVAHGSSGFPSRPGNRPCGDVERLKKLQIAVNNASAYQRRVAAKGAAGGAQPLARPRGPRVIGGVPAGVGRSPVAGVAAAGAGRSSVNGGAPAGASAARSSETAVLQNGLVAMPALMRAMLRTSSRFVHGKTAATAAAARPSAAGRASREH
jgi:hypothetical protein